MTTPTAQGVPAAISMPTATLADKLRVAAAKGQLDVVQELVAAGAGFQSDREGRAAIHFAAMNGHIEVCKYLLDRGCRVEEKDLVGSTALHRAASQGHVQVIELLLEKGCDMDSFDENGNAAVHEAAWHGFSQTLELMIKHDCNTMVINKAGFSALHLAAQNGHNQSTRVLLLAGCNADMKNNYGDTALHTAARYGHAGVTRILISARCCLNEQNKNGDTALHIAAALKRRKIAKLVVDAGIDTLVKNKQFETALEVAKRKEHPEIVLIITSFAKPKASKSGVHKSVNFKDFPIELEGPVVVPDEQVPVKTEKQEKKFFDFFKKKKKDKDKDKSDNKGSQPQNDAPAGSRGNPSVQGFFSQYVPKPGYQYFRDLAGNIKQGPIGYTPVCQCMPTIKKLEHQVFTNRENLYDHIQASNRALNERMDHIDKKTSQQVGELDRYTKERLEKEEDHCNERIHRHFEEEQGYMKRYKDDIKLDIQDLLEAKLGMYGHCLDHHHDDSALPNNNVFTDIHENENGRLFRSRSDETLSQSDNHSGKFRKKEFYESRQQAMQQIRAWQMPMYNRDSRDRGANQRSVGQNNKDKYGVNPQVPNRNEPIRRSNQYVASKFDLQSPSTASTSRTPQVLSPADSAYAVNQGQGAVPKRLPHSQTWHNAQQFRNVSGTVNCDNSINAHSTPKHRESSTNEMYAHGKSMVRSHTETDGLSQKKDQKDLNGNTYFDRKMDVRQSFPERGSQYFNRGNEQRQSFPERGSSNTNTGNRPTSGLSSNAGQGPQEQNRPSSTKPEYQYSANQPTFTTFGYDSSSPQGRPVTSNQSASNNQTPVSSASHQRTRQENPYGYLPSRSRMPHDELSQNKSPSYSLFAVKYERSKTPLARGEQSNSRISNKNTVPNKDDMYISMSQKPIARQRTHSSDGLLLDDELITSAHDMARRSISEERVLDSPVQRSQTPRSSSETRPTSVQNKNSVAQPIYTSSSGNVSSSQTMAPSGAYQSPQTFRSSNYRAQNPRNIKPGGAPSNQGGISNQGTYSGRALRTPTENVYVTMKDSRVNREVVSSSHPTNPQNFQYGAKENGYRSMRESPYTTVRDVSHHRANTTIHYPYTSGKQGAPYHSTYNVNRVTDSDRNMYAGGTVAQPLSKSESNLDRSANDSDHDCGYTSSVSPRGEFISRQTPVDNSSQSKDHLKPVANYPNAYNKEDSSSNPDSGYSSKIFGNRNNGGNIPSNSGTPSSSFSTDHDHSMSISSNNNSPHPQVLHSDYESIQNVQPTPVQVQQGEHLQSHVQNWYQRKLKEAAHRFCDSPYSHEQYASYQKHSYTTNGGQYQYQPTQSPDKYHNQSQYSMQMARNNAAYNAYQQIPSYVRGSDV